MPHSHICGYCHEVVENAHCNTCSQQAWVRGWRVGVETFRDRVKQAEAELASLKARLVGAETLIEWYAIHNNGDLGKRARDYLGMGV